MNPKRFKRNWSVSIGTFIMLVLMGAASLFAQLNTGKIEGMVRDKDTGSPLAGAQVTIEGTRLGNVTNSDGYYFILNVPPGLRSVTFIYTGYQKTTVSGQLILAGQTTTLDAGLSSTIVELEGITIEGESEVLVPRDNTVTKHRLTGDRLEATPTTKMEDLMILEAGVQIGGKGGMERGLRIRGGRVGEELMVVDGVAVRNYVANPHRPGGGWVFQQEEASRGEDTSPLELSTGAVEEVDIITGGFQAEYGNAQSGIINIITKEGGPDLRGNVRFTTDQQNPRTADYGYNQLRVNVGGPVYKVPNLFFHASGEIQGMADLNPSHADEGFRGMNQDFVDNLNYAIRNDPDLGVLYTPFTMEGFRKGRDSYSDKTGRYVQHWSPPNPVRMPGNWGDRTLASGKITAYPTKALKFIGSANFSRVQRSYPTGSGSGSLGNYFHTGIFTKSQLPDRNWDADADTIVYIPQSDARRTRTSNLLAGFNWDFYQSAQRNASMQFRFTHFRNQDINSSSQKTNYHRDTFMSWSPHDIPFEVETWPDRSFPADLEQRRTLLPDGKTAWHEMVDFYTPVRYMEGDHGMYRLGYRYLYEKQNNYKTDIDFQIDRRNRAKLGFQITALNNRMFSITGMSPNRRYANEFNYEPRVYAAYVQHRIDLGDFVIDGGLRWDSFQPKDNWGFRHGDQWGQDYFVKNVNEFSPRFDVAFPVTDKSQIRFAYGVFTQLPSMSFIYSGLNSGGLEYSRTDAFEAGLSYLLSDNMVLDMVAYYRDVDGNVSQKEYFRDYWQSHSGRWVREFFNGYTNRDNGNIKGLDLTLKRRFADNFSFNLIYTLQFSRTTGSQYNTFAAYSGFKDASTGESYVPPDEIRPIDGDRTHKLAGHFNYLFPEDFKAGTMTNTILKNFRCYAIFTLQSGEPLFDAGLVSGSPTDRGLRDITMRGGIPVGGVNAFRDRWFTNLDLRFSKSFHLGKARRLSVFAEIFNVLNRKVNYPYPSGYTYENYKVASGGVERRWEDELSENLRYKFTCDFNQDGVMTVAEQAKNQMAHWNMWNTMDKRKWGIARQIRCGLDLSF